MTTIQIPDELASQIEQGARRWNKSSEDLLREAVLTYLEDHEDAAVAAERLKNPEKKISLEEIGRKYGLAD